MLTKTKGIVLRRVKYKESSFIVDIYTETQGLQTFSVHGVRSRKAGSKAMYFNLMTILDIECSIHPTKKTNSIKEFSFAHKYNNLVVDFVRANIGLFMCEILSACVKQQDEDSALYSFLESSLLYLDKSENSVANLPIFFALRLCQFLGFGISEEYDEDVPFFDLRQGSFYSMRHNKNYCLDEESSALLSALNESDMETMHLIPLNQSMRRGLLSSITDFYTYHIDGFKKLKTIDVLQEVFG